MPLHMNDIIIDSNVGCVLLGQSFFFFDDSEQNQKEIKWLSHQRLARYIATTIHYEYLY